MIIFIKLRLSIKVIKLLLFETKKIIVEARVIKANFDYHFSFKENLYVAFV